MSLFKRKKAVDAAKLIEEDERKLEHVKREHQRLRRAVNDLAEATADALGIEADVLIDTGQIRKVH